jgi:hypothetical protein
LVASLASISVLNTQIELKRSSAVIIILHSVAGSNEDLPSLKLVNLGNSFGGAFSAFYLPEHLEAKTSSIPQEKTVPQTDIILFRRRSVPFEDFINDVVGMEEFNCGRSDVYLSAF